MVRLKYRIDGFTMIEVLVTIVVILLGLLGLAQLHVRIQQSELEAYQRAQALTLLSDMVSRINANRQTAPCYAITGTTGTPYLGAAGSDHLGAPACMGYGSASTQALAISDLAAWDGFLNGTSETQSGAAVGAMIGARGCVTFDAPSNTYTVAIAWQGIADLPAPTVSCANNLYGSETKRRVVWTTLTIGSLL